MDDPLAKLEAEYCPPLDSALLSAIVSDYDLASEEGLATARATLDLLKESALIEEAADFDPSGTGGYNQLETAKSPGREEAGTETGASQSHETDATSLSNGLSSLDLEEKEKLANQIGAQDVGKVEDLDALDEDVKVMLLRELFGEHASKYSIQHTLRKCNGKWNAALEELLNHVYFGEAEDSEDGGKLHAKGVDGFSEDNVVKRGRKTKAKGQKLRAMEERRAASLPASPEDSQSPAVNKWQTSKEDVNFIAIHTNLEVSVVKSTYNEQGAKVPQTINALIKQTMEETKKVVTDDETVQQNARDLGRDFPSIAPNYLAALIRLTYPSTSSAHELAKALVAKPKEPLSAGGIQVIPMYARPTIADIDPESSPRKARSANISHPSSLASPEDPTLALRGNAYAAARAQAFAQASAAHRRAGSDRLMGGAAAYYSQLGRDLSALAFGASADAADALAARQSSSTQLDLHGIDVLNGVRIAQERVEAWWSGLGESRVNGRAGAEDRGAGFRIVVGAGTHSVGGKGKLGPAVSKALKNEGWRIEPAGAVIVVKGKQRR
ncbi:hypothetical protein MBLNU13_g00823t1 [Cladosporium sp. NU13]